MSCTFLPTHALMLGVACQHRPFWHPAAQTSETLCSWCAAGSGIAQALCILSLTVLKWTWTRHDWLRGCLWVCAVFCHIFFFSKNTHPHANTHIKMMRLLQELKTVIYFKNHPVTWDQTMRRWQKRAPRCLLIEMPYIHHVFLNLKPASDTSKE